MLAHASSKGSAAERNTTQPNRYWFLTEWLVEGSREEVYAILSDPLDLPRWWPDVYLEAEELRQASPDGLGQVVRFKTKGWLPYRLHWRMKVTERFFPQGFSLSAEGDFDGTGIWRFQEDEGRTMIEFEWTIVAEKPLLRKLSWLLKPLFAWNHRWAMAKGEESLKRELARRKAAWVSSAGWGEEA